MTRDFGGEATLEQAEEALRLVQNLDPPGVGARDLRECLLLQLTPETPSHDVLRTLISNHLDDLQHNRLPAIEKKTGFPIETIKEAIEHLRRLNPKPGASFTTDSGTQYVVPDLIVEPNEEGGTTSGWLTITPPICRFHATTRSNSGTSRPTRPRASSSRSGSSRPGG